MQLHLRKAESEDRIYYKIKFGNPAKTYELVLDLEDEYKKPVSYENTQLFQTTSQDNKSYLAVAYSQDILIMTFGYAD